ncbi:MAG: tRNA (guanosine(37)-N1)-methyltransferase TrmD [bacterium]
MQFNIITIFPEMFSSYFSQSMLKRAQDKKLIKIKIHDLRNWTNDRHKTVDDTPYGGGAGMVMKIEPLYKAIKHIKGRKKVILLSAKGKTWNQQMAKKYSKSDNLVLICGRYEGVDERIKYFVDEEISVGDYVITGGELGAMIIVDSVSRLIPGVLGNEQSNKDESHSQPGVLEYPQYTKPEVFKIGRKKYAVPKILLSGNHKEIKEWKEKKSKLVIL